MPSKNYEESLGKLNQQISPSENDGSSKEAREIDLTDKLNKNLLQSFLTRLNQSDANLKKFITPNTQCNDNVHN